MRLLNNAVLIIWKWAWENESSSTDHDSDDGNDEDDLKDGDNPVDGDNPECDQANTETSKACVSDAIHTVIFKCIGSVRDVKRFYVQHETGFKKASLYKSDSIQNLITDSIRKQ